MLLLSARTGRLARWIEHRRTRPQKNGDWTADAVEEGRWRRSLVQSFARGQSNDD